MSNAQTELLVLSYSTVQEANRAIEQQHDLIRTIQTEQPHIRHLEIHLKGVLLFPRITIPALPMLQPQLAISSKDAIDQIFAQDCHSAITEMGTDICLLTNGQGSPERLIWEPAKYQGFNYRWLWRDSMDDYERLYQALRQEGKAENFSYKLRRVDGSLARYTADYTLVEEFLGVAARMSFNHEWQLVEPAPVGS